MKKSLGRGLAILALTAGLAGGSLAASDVRFGFSLSGGIGNINGGDFNLMIRDQNAFVADYNDEIMDEYWIDWKEMKWLPKFGGDLYARFGRYFGVGLGVEYIKKTNPGSMGVEYEDSMTEYHTGYYTVYSETYSTITTISQTLTVIPITLSFYGFLPVGPRAEAYVRAGAGYYLGKLASDQSDVGEMIYHENYYLNSGSPYPPHYHAKIAGSGSETWEATCNAFGAHFGAGFNFDVSNNLALFAEAFYRMVNFKDWRGSLTGGSDVRFYAGWTNATDASNLPQIDSISYDDAFDGGLWFFEDIWESLATGAYGQYGMYEDAPEEDGWTDNVRPFELNLNGFTFKVGIKISFGGR